MVATGKWSDSGLGTFFSTTSSLFSILNHMLTWTNDVEVISGWDATYLGINVQAQGYASKPDAWQASVLVAAGVRMRECIDPWQLSIVWTGVDKIVYGYTLGIGSGTTQQIYAERFQDGPYLITEDIIIPVRPRLYLRNQDGIIP